MNLLIIGAGEYGKLVQELARNKYATIDFLDDKSELAVGKIEDCKNLRDRYSDAIAAIGDNEVRVKWFNKLKEIGYNLPILISEKAYVSPTAAIGEGCIVEPMAVINTNAKVGEGTIVSAGAVINHNATVKQGCHIDCNAVVGADAVVPEKMHLNYGQVIIRGAKPEIGGLGNDKEETNIFVF